ncbi:trans-aconitate 2-methyltransferase [Jatrophihabitans endophyticus]|uniref:class I SAM-dependent methyltransferase n=1 Tax=Jatrophihabitans endophyticus TaxID=1206085 RepID=UPI0019FFCAB4|nr:class I SAM-dependent methyltransferase [Jatrophihabitans endophyticus]MBE7188601.1 class I SAM-dependent methyltransferase [Jatrophihabitans endophyticus]
MAQQDTGTHWDRRWSESDTDQVSWYEPVAATSSRLIVQNCPASTPVVDVGAGRSTLAASLVQRGYHDVTVLDVSQVALGSTSRGTHRVVTDVLSWHPARQYGAWHDRAVFHFLTDLDDQARYRRLAVDTILPGGCLVLATFAPGGPDSCSGLPVHRWDAEKLGAFFAPAFSAVHSETEDHTTPTGAVQPFTWLVLRRTNLSDSDTEDRRTQ